MPAAAIRRRPRTLDEIITTHANGEDDEFVRAVIADILADDDPARLLAPLVRGHLLTRRRAQVRLAEHLTWDPAPERGATRPAAGRPGGNGAAAVARANPVMRERLRALLNREIWIPGGDGYVSWGNATVEQLQRRAGMYADQQQNLDRAIDRITSAVTLIQSKPGARCLNDVYGR
jgi:hypothetical protein